MVMESEEMRLWNERKEWLVWVGKNVEEEEELLEAKVRSSEDRSESEVRAEVIATYGAPSTTKAIMPFSFSLSLSLLCNGHWCLWSRCPIYSKSTLD